MTRARASLTLLASGTHPFVEATVPALLGRQVAPDTARLSVGMRRFIAPDPKLVDLSHAGRLPQGHPTLAAIAAARVGDPISLRQVRDRWLIVNRAGEVLGRMSRAFRPPRGLVLVKAEIAAILAWRSEDGDEAYRTRHHRPSWEVVLPELVYGQPTAGDDAQKRPGV